MDSAANTPTGTGSPVNDRMAAFGMWLVIAGLIAEAAVLYWFATEKSWLEAGLTILATLVIALGVWMEHHWGKKADRESAERIAQANKDAEIAKQETARLQLELAQVQGQVGFAINEAGRAQRMAASADTARISRTHLPKMP